MKTLMTAVALAALIASPAFAATKKVTTQVRATAAQSYALAPPSSAVVVDGQVIGADPDPNVRLQLQRDGEQLNGG